MGWLRKELNNFCLVSVPFTKHYQATRHWEGSDACLVGTRVYIYYAYQPTRQASARRRPTFTDGVGRAFEAGANSTPCRFWGTVAPAANAQPLRFSGNGESLKVQR